MEQTQYSLIMTIVNKGYCDEVMKAARGAGAKGGTILTARGTGNIEAEKLFGVVIVPEKEIVMIVTETKYRHDIMVAIYKEVGLTTAGSGFSFALPVGEIVGISALTTKIDENAEDKAEEKSEETAAEKDDEKTEEQIEE